jgi:hypothetical protein
MIFIQLQITSTAKNIYLFSQLNTLHHFSC